MCWHNCATCSRQGSQPRCRKKTSSPEFPPRQMSAKEILCPSIVINDKSAAGSPTCITRPPPEARRPFAASQAGPILSFQVPSSNQTYSESGVIVDRPSVLLSVYPLSYWAILVHRRTMVRNVKIRYFWHDHRCCGRSEHPDPTAGS